MSKSLEIVIADWREKASAARALKDPRVAQIIDDFCTEVAESAEDYLRFLSETDARIWSGKSVAWLRGRFAEWEAMGHAEKRKGVRYYRAVILPRRPDVIAARAAGLSGERPSRERKAG